MSNRKLRIGFVGAGGMGQMAHWANYARMEEACEIVAVAEAKPELAQLIASRFGVPEVYHSHTDLLANAKVDAIVAPQPYRRHTAIIPDILRAGIPVFTEKPVALTVEAGEQLATLGEELGVLHMVGNHKRSDPATEYAKAVIDSWKANGECGKLKYIRVSMPPGDWIGGADMPLNTTEPYPTEGGFEPFPAYFDEQAGKEYDTFVNYYIHQVNMIHFLLGEHFKVTYADRGGVLLVGESDSGVTVTLEMAAYQTSVAWDEAMFVSFEHGYVSVELPPPLARQQAGRVRVMKDSGGTPTITEPIMPNVAAMRRQAYNFLAAVRGERPAPCTARQAVQDLIVARDYVNMMQQYK